MPKIAEVQAAAEKIAVNIGPGICSRYFFDCINDVVKYPEDWGFPRSFRDRPNWTTSQLRREVAGVLWRKPTHPDRIPAAYAGLPFKIMSQIADGGIASLWWDAPSSRVRHEWLCACSTNRRYRQEDWRRWLDSPLSWVIRHCPAGSFVPRTRLIADWLVEKKNWVGWHRPMPIGYGPEGQMRTIKPQDLLDEIWDDDLVNGVKTNPERLFRALMDKKGEDALAKIAEESFPFPKMPWTTIEGVVQILSSRELVEEGRRMQHCVGVYANSCRKGQCFILRLPNSTAEITSTGEIYQHRSYKNSDPSPSDKQLLARWVSSRKETANELERKN